MKRLWHAITGHEWRPYCGLCAQLRYHEEHERQFLACSCGAVKLR